MSKIFESHFTTKRNIGGTGVGLYMTKIMIEKHMNAELKVENVNFEYENNCYKGAEFSIILPLSS